MRLTLCLMALAALCCAAAEIVCAEEMLDWGELPELPAPQGMERHLGVAGPFAGVSGEALIVAGGANFPNGAPWDGGEKVWWDDVYVLEEAEAEWRTGFKLPRPLGYGASVTTDRGIICIGGCDGDRCYSDVFALKWNPDSGEIETETLPSLPEPLAFMSAARIGDIVYVAGGQTTMTDAAATNTFWSLNLADGGQWEKLASWNGPSRILPVLAAQHDGMSDKVYLFSGRDAGPGRETVLLKDVHRFDPAAGTWTKMSDSPRCLMAGMGAAIGAQHILLMGGDDGRYWGQDLRDDHPGFPDDMLFAYHTVTDTWVQRGELPKNHVTSVLVEWDGGWVIPSGEIRPAVRSPKVWRAMRVDAQQRFSRLDYAVLGVYLASLIVMGAYFSRREKTTHDFFLAGGRIPWWAAGLSIFGTQLSAITFMAIPAKSYATDWMGFLYNMGIVAIAPLIVFCFLPFYRRLNVTSAYEYLEKRFNVAVRLLGSGLFIIFQFGRIGIVLLLPSLALSVVTGMSVHACILVMGILATVYTVMGGIEAVIWTDVLQVVVLMGGALVAMILVALEVDGGFPGMFATALEDGKLHMVDWNLDFTTLTIWVVLLAWANHLIPYASDQSVIQRYMTTKDEASSRRAIWTNAILVVPASLIFFGMGTALYVFYKQHPVDLNPAMESADAIFPWYIMHELPAGLSGLLIAGIFAAAMSSLDSSMNSMSTAVVTDFYRRFRKGLTETHCLRVARLLTALFGVVGTVFALVMASTDIKSLWDVFIMYLGLLGGGLGGLFVLGIFTRRANGPGAIVGLLASGIVQYAMKSYTELHSYMFAFSGMVSCVVIGYLASFLFSGTERDLEGLTIFTLRTKGSEDDGKEL